MLTPYTKKRKLPQATGKAIKRLLGSHQPSVPRILRSAHELKNFDVVINGNPGGVLGNLQLLSGIIQGSSGINRTGREIFVEHVELHIDVAILHTGLDGDSDLARVDLVKDAQSKGAAPVLADITTSATYVGYLYNNDNVKRFRHLYDTQPRAVNLLGIAPTAGAPSSNRIVINRKIRVGSRIRYYNASNAGTVADCETGALILCMSNANSVTTFTGNARVWFRDV